MSTIEVFRETEKTLSQYIQKTEELKDENIALFYGMTGAGKSTIINALVNGENLEYNEDEDCFQVKDYLKDANNNSMFAVSDSVVSCTRSPQFLKK